MSPHVLDRLSAYVDGELSPPDRALVAEHLAGCEECSRRLQTLGVVDAAARALPAEPPPGYFAAFPSRVRRRLEGDTRERSWRMPAWAWAAAAAALLAVVAPLTLMRAPLPGGLPREENALPTPGFAATLPAAPPEAPATASPARPEPRPPELQARTAARAEGNAATPEAVGGGRAAPADAMAPGGAGAASPSVPPPPSAPRLVVESRVPEAKAAFGAPAQTPSPEKDEARPSVAGALTEREARTAPLERGRAQGGESGARDKGQPEALPDVALKRAAPHVPVEADRLYRTLLYRSAQTLTEARELREAWRSFSRLHAEGAPADEARVRVVETGAQAYRLGSDPDDLARLRDDARAYLERKDAAQAVRVRAALEALGLQP
jgi:hypothetical protein